MWILLLFLIFAPFSPYIDLYVSEFFYSPEQGFYNNYFFHILFKYGELFGIASGGVACLIFALSFVCFRCKKWRQAALTLVLTLIIGAGLITNMGFKKYWGRPRPKQIVEFGGKHLYRAFWNPDFHTKNDPQKSFPSGHVAMGFYFLSLCLVGKRLQSPLLYKWGLSFTLLLGCGLMIGRVVQGGHFVSDVLAAFVIMWYTSHIIDWIIWKKSKLFHTAKDR